MSEISSMTPREFVDRWPDFATSPAVMLLDVREPDEFAAAHVAGTTHIPMAQIPGRLGELDRDRTIVVMCHGGVRSMQVAAYLDRQGFAHVVNLHGGIDAWSREVDMNVPRY